MNLDANLKNADWPKRTPDHFEDLVKKFDPSEPRDTKGRWTKGGKTPQEREDDEAMIDIMIADEGTPTAAMKAEPLPKTLAEAEDRIRHEPREHAFLLRDGKPFMVLGDDDKHHVRMDGATEDDLKDAVLTHNHPSGFGLSNQDGITAAKRNMLEMRAVVKGGAHVIRRTGDRWPEEFDVHLKQEHHDLMVELGTRLHDGDITVEEANSLHHKMIYKRLQKKLGGFTYTFEPKS